MKHLPIPFACLAAAALPLAAQALPTSSTLPRGEVQLNRAFLNVGVQGYGAWRVAAPRERVPAGPAGTVPSANSAYAVYMDQDAQGRDTLEFRRTTDGGLTWQPAQTIYTLVAGEVFDGNENRIVCSEHEVFVVFATNAHNLQPARQSVWAMGSADQGQTWTAPVLLSTGSLTTLYDADEVNAAVSRLQPSSPASLNVVWEADYAVPPSGIEDLFFAQAELQNGSLVVTVPETRLNRAVAPTTTDVNFTAIAAHGPVVHVAWTDNRSGGGTRQYDYFSLTSRNNATDWATTVEYRHTSFVTPLTWDTPRRPRVAVDLPHVYTFMEHSLNGKDDVWMDWSSDLGTTFAATGIAINTATLGNLGDVDDMIVVAGGQRVAVVYVDDRLNGTNNNNNNQAVVAVSNNGGADFQAGTHVEVPLSLKDPNPIFDIQMQGDVVAVLYETNCGPGEDVAVSLSADGGRSFTHYDITQFGGCGLRPGSVDVDDPRLALTANGDVVVAWIDDRSVQGTGLGNAANNLWVTGIKYPQLLDQTAVAQGLRYQDDSPAAAGDLCLVLVSGTGTSAPLVLDNQGFRVNLTYDFWTGATIGGAFGLPPGPPNLNLDLVGSAGAVQFALVPNVTQLLGLPFWAAALTIRPNGQPGRFTDPIRFR